MIRGRLAPSPTGALHLGNARTFLLAWLSLRAQGGQVVLRIEDLDGPRVKPESVAQLIDDLQWLGLDWDEGPAAKVKVPQLPRLLSKPPTGPRSKPPTQPLTQSPTQSPFQSPIATRPADQLNSQACLGSLVDSGELGELGELGEFGPYVQTRRLAWYQAAWERLAEAGRIYPCRCSRTDIERAASAPHVGDEGPPYPGTCRPERRGAASSLVAAPGPNSAQPGPNSDAQPGPNSDAGLRSGLDAGPGGGPPGGRVSGDLRERPPAWRFRVPGGDAAVVRFRDGFLGEQVGDVAATSGDFVVWKGSGTAAYQLAVVVDDAAMAITEVVRGDDLLSSTPRQLLLYEALGLRPPRFWHVPLVVGPDGRRLAKRHGDTRIRWFRDAGIPPERLVGWLAWQSGLGECGAASRPADLIDRFGWSKVPRERIVCDRDAVCRTLG